MRRLLLIFLALALTPLVIGCAPLVVPPQDIAPKIEVSLVGKDAASQIQALKEFRVRLISEMLSNITGTSYGPYDFRNYAQAVKYASESIALMKNEP